MRKLFLLFIPLVFLFSCGSGEQLVRDGKADAAMYEGNFIIPLDGQWLFTTGGTDGIINVPSIWRGKITEGTYRAVISLTDDEKQYSLYIRDCFTSYSLTVNGNTLHSGSVPSIKPRIFTFSARGQTEIRIDAQDRDTTFGGIKSTLYFGTPDKVYGLFNRRMFADLLMTGALLFASVFYLCIGIVDRKGGGREYLYLFAANLLMAVRFLTTYNRFILLFIDDFFIIERISTVTTPLIAISYSLFFLRLYRYPGFTRVIRIFMAFSTLYALMVMTLPILLIYRISPLYVALMLAAVYSTVHISFIHFRTAELKRTTVLWVLVLGALAYLLIRAYLIWRGLIPEQTHHLYGVLLLLQGVQNAVRYGETFKYNVRLIEQKDGLFSRVSHSLKTPLYALKGSLDIVRSSSDAGEEFGKQYKVMDAGITDLMVQINDLLNLTEFEFSHQMVKTRVPVTASVQTVLIVDDQDIISSILGQQLRLFVRKLNLLTARSAEQALFILNTNNVDFIFSDIMMPGMNGYDFVIQCRSQGFLVPIYLFSAGSDPHCREKSLDVGANGYLEKPATIEQLKKVTSLHLLHIGD